MDATVAKQAFLVYTCGFFSNAGNYKGSGNSKIIPNLPVTSFERIVKTSKAYANDENTIENLWSQCKKPLYLLTPRTETLALADSGITTYFSDNCTVADSELICEWLKTKSIESYNCRTFKTIDSEGRSVYDIRLASIECGDKDGITMPSEIFKGSLFKVTRGDYTKLLAMVVDELVTAKRYAANDNQIKMLEHFVQSFTDGNINEHKNGSRFIFLYIRLYECQSFFLTLYNICRYWIKDKSPIIETHMGFVFCYRDPVGGRAEFSAFVAMINKDLSAKFEQLVIHAKTFLDTLPWGPDFEKDTFLKPDFTSMDVLSFTGSLLPAGINVPVCKLTFYFYLVSIF